MTPIVFYFDVVSPYAYLAFEHWPEAMVGCSHVVEYRPVLFAGLLKAHAHKGPAEIAPKREWMFRQIEWLARRHGVASMRTPAPHPFNPLALLRLSLACGPAGRMPNRRIVEAVMRHAWQGQGADPNDPARLASLRAQLAPQRDPDSDEVKAELRALTDAAVARGIFGVPTFEAQGQLYWGLDSLPMLREALQGTA
ncbi:2-hydroxychromene-2-carboxylate isomerase [Ideonella sp. DXS29W]|uniref:2-hydroxychromene-2-carboxylate isomerase n=1 Tax=Ideonella lacteola TaxID=2984193 RepID=A0ABU9BQA0_9BURK